MVDKQVQDHLLELEKKIKEIFNGWSGIDIRLSGKDYITYDDQFLIIVPNCQKFAFNISYYINRLGEIGYQISKFHIYWTSDFTVNNIDKININEIGLKLQAIAPDLHIWIDKK